MPLQQLEKIKSGQYFKEARDYYIKKYVSQAVLHHYLYAIVVALGLSAYLLLSSALVTFDVATFPLPIYFDNATEAFPVLKEISSPNQTPEQEVADYMSRKYVTVREEYQIRDLEQKRLENKVNFINTLSARRVFNEYNNYIDINKNPNSPYIKYKRLINREIFIDKVEFTEKEGIVKVYFSAIERRQKTVVKKEKLLANITYTMTKIKPEFEGRRFNFLIRKYDLTKLNESE